MHVFARLGVICEYNLIQKDADVKRYRVSDGYTQSS